MRVSDSGRGQQESPRSSPPTKVGTQGQAVAPTASERLLL